MIRKVHSLWLVLLLAMPAFSQQPLTITVNGVSFKMIHVQGGTFTMGATREQANDATDDEKPAHKVTLSSYYIGETEVTQQLWLAVMGSNPSHFAPKTTNASRCEYDSFVADAKRLNAKRAGTVRIPTRQEWDAAMTSGGGSLKRPVETVSWDDCQTFIRKLNQLTGRQFRLPTEAEWEFAARGGTKGQGYKYSGGNSIGTVAWYGDNACNNKDENDSGYGTHNVKTKRANELGIYDMSGNVWEWCQDWYGHYNSEAQNNPKGPSSGSRRILRGGSWSSYYARYCRVSYRNSYSPGYSFSYLGLRLAL